MVRLGRLVPPEPDVGGAILALHDTANQAQVAWSSFVPTPATPGAGTVPATLGVGMKIAGTFGQVFDYLARLETLDRLVVVDSIQLSGSELPTGRCGSTPTSRPGCSPPEPASPLRGGGLGRHDGGGRDRRHDGGPSEGRWVMAKKAARQNADDTPAETAAPVPDRRGRSIVRLFLMVAGGLAAPCLALAAFFLSGRARTRRRRRQSGRVTATTRPAGCRPPSPPAAATTTTTTAPITSAAGLRDPFAPLVK